MAENINPDQPFIDRQQVADSIMPPTLEAISSDLALLQGLIPPENREAALEPARRIMFYATSLFAEARHDKLTRVPNRTFFEEIGKISIRRAIHENYPFAALMIDLDGFKPVNDQYGHAVGDEVLKAIASRVRALKSIPDHVARLGGDEFALLLNFDRKTDDPELQIYQTVEGICTRLLNVIKAPMKVSDDLSIPPVAVGATIGAAILLPERASSLKGRIFETVINTADQALYVGKEVGRGVATVVYV